MQAAPAFQITLERFGVWRALSAFLALATLAGLWAWAWREGVDTPMPALGLACFGTVLGTMVMASAWRLRAVSLRWDTQRWHLGPASSRGNEPRAGEVQVTWDAGGFMLLRFRPENGGVVAGQIAWGRPWMDIWLPVQKRGHADRWHALRCTVYCARPRATFDPADGP